MSDEMHELEVKLWPLNIKAKGSRAVQAVKRPVAILLVVFALALLIVAVTHTKIGGGLRSLVFAAATQNVMQAWRQQHLRGPPFA